jgi:uncharacterized SAM-binding protein YcdF (DUF218 family)
MSFRLKILVVAMILAVVWVVVAPLLATYLIVEKPIEHADAIIVLSGSAAYKERTRKAAELYKAGASPKIFVTNDGARSGWSRDEQRNIPYVELEQRELIGNGVLPDAITVLPATVTGTDSEARALASEIDARPVKSLLVVTSAYHTRRALWTFDRLLAPKGVIVGIEHPPTGDASPEPAFWWLYTRGWPMVAAEYVKAIVYWAFY